MTTRRCPNGTEGAGRGDTVRLRAGGTLRRVDGVARKRGPSHPVSTADHLGGSASVSWERVSAKRGEPHDRQRDATSPRTSVRSKPSRWCETTRAERELDGWCRRPEGVPGQLGALGVDAQKSCRWRGIKSRTPREEGPRSPVGASVPFGVAARGPARVRTLRRRWKIMESR
jgi:hypothetical protein